MPALTETNIIKKSIKIIWRYHRNQWYSNTANNNTTGSLIGGATSASYSPSNTLTGTTFYYCVVSGCSPSATSNVSGGITINTLPANPTGTISGTNPACTSTTMSYSAPNASIYWQTAATGTSTASPTTSAYPVSTNGTTVYARTYNGTCWSSGTVNSGAVVVSTTPVFTTSPANTTAASPATATFTVVTTGTVSSYQWQVNDGGGWVNVPTSTIYSGMTTATLSINPTSLPLSGYQYRCIAKTTAPCSDVTSSAATLTVNMGPWEDFETGSKSGYTTGSVTCKAGSWTFINALLGNTGGSDYFNGTQSARIQGNATQAGIQMNFDITTGLGTVTLSHGMFGTDANGTWRLECSTDGGSTWTAFVSSKYTSTSTSFATQTITVNIIGTVRFRILKLTTTSTSNRLNIDDIFITPYNGCITPDSLVFVQQSTVVAQDAAMTPSVTVKAVCKSTGFTAVNYSGFITLTAANGGCGYVSQTAPAVNGIATFSNIKFTRSTQTAVKLIASGSGMVSTVSDTFSVALPSIPAGSPTNIKNEDFDGGSPTWSYSAVTVQNDPGSADVIGVSNPSSGFGNGLVKSYSGNVTSATGQLVADLITFANVTGLGSYTNLSFSFNLASLGTGAGAGIDGGESTYIETSLDGGTTWNKVLTYLGTGDYTWAMTSTPVTTLAYNANVTYSTGSRSAFLINLPAGTTQFQFRWYAMANRTTELVTLDNLKLIGTPVVAGAPKSLPAAVGSNPTPCPLTNATLSASVSNAIGSLTYNWSPTTNFSGSSTATSTTPTVSFASGSTIYTVTTTDADGCTAIAKDTVTITNSPGGVILSPVSISLQEVICQDATGWTYYADPSDLTKWQFAIYKNGNNFTANVNLNIKTTGNTAYDNVNNAGNRKANFTMGRHWNVTLASGSINGSTNPVKVRFFYDPADTAQIKADALTQATAWGLSASSVHPIEWFKTNAVTYAPSNNGYSDVPNKLNPSTFSTTTGSANGVSYVEYAGLQGFSGGTGGVRLSPGGYGLPVKLIFINATPINNDHIKINWSTASEIDNKGFDIERSTNGIDFEKIAWIDGKGNSTAQIDYLINDNSISPNVIYYYRLRQIDFDGRYEYSEIVSATIMGSKGFIFEELRPNPATNQVFVNVATEASQIATIVVTDMLGREVINQNWSLSEGLNGTTLDISALAMGTYSVVVKTDGTHLMKKLVVTK